MSYKFTIEAPNGARYEWSPLHWGNAQYYVCKDVHYRVYLCNGVWIVATPNCHVPSPNQYVSPYPELVCQYATRLHELMLDIRRART